MIIITYTYDRIDISIYQEISQPFSFLRRGLAVAHANPLASQGSYVSPQEDETRRVLFSTRP